MNIRGRPEGHDDTGQKILDADVPDAHAVARRPDRVDRGGLGPMTKPVGLEFLIRPPLATEPGPGSEMPTVCC